MPSVMPDSSAWSRIADVGKRIECMSVVRPFSSTSSSVQIAWPSIPSLPSLASPPSMRSVCTMRSGARTSRYSPVKPNSPRSLSLRHT